MGFTGSKGSLKNVEGIQWIHWILYSPLGVQTETIMEFRSMKNLAHHLRYWKTHGISYKIVWNIDLIKLRFLSLGIFYISQGARIFALLGGFWGICGGFSCFRFNEWNYILGGILRM